MTHVISFPVETDLDPSALLDIAQELAARMALEIEDHGEDAEIDEGEVSVLTM